MTVLLIWTAGAAWSMFLTWRWLARSDSRAQRGAVVATGAAAVPSVTLLAQCFVRVGREQPFGNLVDGWTVLSCAWIVIGPLLLAYGALRARRIPRGQRPTGVQLSHTLLWAISSLAGLLFTANAC